MNIPVNSSCGDVNDCGCCEGVSVQIPLEVYNRPSLAAIAYRIGNYNQFKQSLLASLTLSNLPILHNLKTRNDDDFSIALIDAWATIADILTFYQERIAHESYLRTATERASILELARLIGYKLNPGVAASTYLAFTLEDAPGTPRQATIDIGTKVQSIPGPGEQPQTFETIEKIVAKAEWNILKPKKTKTQQLGLNSTKVYIKGVNTNLKPGDGLLFIGEEWEQNKNTERWDFRRIETVIVDQTAGYTIVTWSEKLGSAHTLPASQPKVYALRQRAALFGHNAPDPNYLPPTTVSGLITGNQWNNFNIFYGSSANNTIYLDALYPQIIKHSWIVLSMPIWTEVYEVESVVEDSQTRFTLSSKTTRLKLKGENLEQFRNHLRDTVVFAHSQLLELAEEPITEPLQRDKITLDRFVLGLEPKRSLIVSGKLWQSDLIVSEVVAIASIANNSNTITLTGSLQNIYDRSTVIIYANVALATHGETKAEVIGSGDASQSYQSFTLRQPPLTYTSAATPTGGESTLQISVNDTLWHEVPRLYEHKPSDRIFVTSIDDRGKTTIKFGDGKTGARLPTGKENITATYRQGIGLGGNLKAEQLSLLITRSLGVKGVSNPIAAIGGDNPETLTTARNNAPLTVLTLDRIVSLQDYEDFARAYAGIAKALATWTWSNQVRSVFITVAGPNGQDIPADSSTYKNLLVAIKKASDPYVPLRLQSYRPAFFRVAAKVKIAPDYRRELVLVAVEKSLRSQFSFDARAFTQPVTLSEAITVIQTVPGVLAVDIDQLKRTDNISNDGLKNPLFAAAPQPISNTTVLAAELLTLAPNPIKLGVMT